jgi:hypothetical protein
MAQQKITVEFEAQSVDRLRRAITQAIKDGRGPAVLGETLNFTPAVEPIMLTVPTTSRRNKATPQPTEDLFLFFDSDNQEHWVTQAVGDDHPVWRQAFFLPRP